MGWCCCWSGIFVRSQPARLASAAVIILTVAKVFLYDMAGLTGLLRALSFIGLGLVLVGIGYLYQRLLFPPRPPAAAPPGSGGRSALTIPRVERPRERASQDRHRVAPKFCSPTMG